ncbi:hypothetical protein [Methanoregula sp.]|jgi:hypothetical protein|uniref:hypothetical protein n=1 Tax=Methanoregula sp. TaxID=2052170 RepID=UPI003C275174
MSNGTPIRGRMIMVQDIEKTVRALREAALGNCRKRIAAAAERRKVASPGDPRHGEEGPGSSTCYGVTMILKSRHNL